MVIVRSAIDEREIELTYQVDPRVEFDAVSGKINFLDLLSIQTRPSSRLSDWFLAAQATQGASLPEDSDLLAIHNALNDHGLVHTIVGGGRGEDPQLQVLSRRIFHSELRTVTVDKVHAIGTCVLGHEDSTPLLRSLGGSERVVVIGEAAFQLTTRLMRREIEVGTLSKRELPLVSVLIALGLVRHQFGPVSLGEATFQWEDRLFHGHAQKDSTLFSGATRRFQRKHFPPVRSVPRTSGPPVELEVALNSHAQSNLYEMRRTHFGPAGDRAMAGRSLKGLLSSLYRRTQSGRRSWPSAGNLYSLNLYLVVQNVTGIAQGLYAYDCDNHRLAPITADQELVLTHLRRSNTFLEHGELPAAQLLITSDFNQVSWHYERLAYRLVLLEAGALLQNIYLLGAQFQLGIRPIGGSDVKFVEDQLLAGAGTSELFLLEVELHALEELHER